MGDGEGMKAARKIVFHGNIDDIIIAKKTVKKLWLYFSTSLNKTTYTITRIQDSSIGSKKTISESYSIQLHSFTLKDEQKKKGNNAKCLSYQPF